MLTWMRHHHKTIMFGTVMLVVPSFILLYGFDQIQRDPEAQTVAKVYGERIPDSAYFRLRDRISENYRQSETEVTPETLKQEALDALIKRHIQRRIAAEMGLTTTNTQLMKDIHDTVAGISQTGSFDMGVYRYVLSRQGMTPGMYEALRREEITTQKLQNTLQMAAFTSDQEKQDAVERKGNKAFVEVLTFSASDFTDDVEVDESGLKSYFEDNIETYRIPEKRRVRYLEFVPAEFRDRVRTSESRLQTFFNTKQQDYMIADQRALECILYKGADFEAGLEVTDDALQAYLGENQARYRTREERKAKFVAIPYTDFVSSADLTDEEIEAEYESKKSQFTHPEQVRARHILIKAESDDPEALAKTESILEEIEGGRDFADAASEYSEGPTKARGGDLDYFPRGQMVPEFDAAAFDTEVGSVTGPIQTQFGYHLVKVEDHREAGTEPLTEVRDQIVEDLIAAKGKEAATERFATLPSALEDIPNAPAVRHSEWFQRGGNIEGVEDQDRYTFSSAAFSTEIDQIGDVVTGQTLVYLVEPIEKRDPSDQTLDEVRSRVESDYKRDSAKKLATDAAEQDRAKLDTGEQTWEALAEIRGATLETGLFERTARSLPGLPGNTYPIISQAFSMEQGNIEGPADTSNGSVLYRMVGARDAYLPTLDEVRGRVTADYIEERQQEQARRAAGRLSEMVAQQDLDLRTAAESSGLSTLDTELFEEDGTIPGMGRKPGVAKAAFELEAGGVSGVIESTRPDYSAGYQQQPQQIVDRFYVVEVTEIVEDRLPEFDEAREDGERDYKLHMAQDVIEGVAKAAQQDIAGRLAAADPVSATQTLDFEALADELRGSFTRPTGALSRESSSLPGVGTAYQLARTVVGMATGEITPAVPVYDWTRNDDNQLERGDVKAYVIAQVVGRGNPAEATDEEKRQTEQFQLMQNMYRSQLAYNAWIEEASRAAFASGQVEIRDEYFNPQSDTIDDEEGDGGSEDASAAGSGSAS